ncbi:hypothetical protein N9N67_09580 [Bacteriovoracaceae bacterium]|nr:hypothetical protein [Bacteriovoracaceae bacterium]
MRVKLFLILVILFSFNTFSKEILVHKSLLISDDVEANFNANRDLDRGWVELVKIYDDVDWDDEIVRIKLDGLSYKDGKIVYDLNGENVVCAVEKKQYAFKPLNIFRKKGKKKKKVIGYYYKKQPKNCRLSVTTPYLTWDDGFKTYRREHVVVKLIINPND